MRPDFPLCGSPRGRFAAEPWPDSTLQRLFSARGNAGDYRPNRLDDHLEFAQPGRAWLDAQLHAGERRRCVAARRGCRSQLPGRGDGRCRFRKQRNCSQCAASARVRAFGHSLDHRDTGARQRSAEPRRSAMDHTAYEDSDRVGSRCHQDGLCRQRGEHARGGRGLSAPDPDSRRQPERWGDGCGSGRHGSGSRRSLFRAQCFPVPRYDGISEAGPGHSQRRREMSFVPVEHVPDVLDGRAGFCLRGEWGHLSAVLGGGHICQLVQRSHPQLNPLWRPQWNTIDPERFSPTSDEDRFGVPPDGRLLAGIAGHSLSFDYFGPPSQEEMAAGRTTHGEAPVAQWQMFREFQEGRPGVEYGAELPVAQIEFRRTLRIDREHPVVYCEEKARNLARADRPISWTEHVTIGPPFLECGATRVDMPATQARVNQASYSDAMMITPDADFHWPFAPVPGGGFHDLRTTPDGCYLRYTAQLLDPDRAIGFTAIANPSAGLLLVYVFRRSDFPW